MQYKVVGERIPRRDAYSKVTGEAVYTADIKLPGMLIAKVLRSPFPHARILNIDTSRAKALIGVKAVITGFDAKGIKWGVFPYTRDHPMLPTDKVRYVGEDVAAVAATDEEIALEALDLIKVEYEPLPAVFDPIEAMQEGAPLIHDEFPRNINIHVHIERGDVDRAFKEAYLVREDTFRAAGEAYAMLEPYAVIAHYHDGYLELWCPNAGPHVRAKALSNLLGIPLHRIKVRRVSVGGAFGGRSEIQPADFIASLLSIKTGKPVKLVLTREENAMCTRQVHDVIATIKTAVKRDGTIIAKEFKVIYDGGAYSSTGPIATSVPFYVYEETYRLPNVRYDGYRVFTNKGIRGMYGCHGRAFLVGNEVQLDMIAEELGLDPVEIRLKNGLKVGDETATRSRIISCGLEETIRKAAQVSKWWEKRKTLARGKGIGLGSVAMMCGFPMGFRSSSTCYVKFDEDGHATVITAIIDNGQGNEQMVLQIAAEVLGLPVEHINLVNADTEVTSLDPGAYSQAATFVGGNAVKRACEDARRQILNLASEMMNIPQEQLELKEGMVISKDQTHKLSIAAVIREAFYRERPIIGVGCYMPNIDREREWVSNPYGQLAGTFSYGTTIAEVEVESDTGRVHFSKAVAAHDCGFPINPMAVEGQIEGSIVQAGVALLMEKNLWHKGFLLNPDLLEYKVPLACDVPEIEPIIVESHDPEGPFGAKEGGLTIRMNAYSALACALYHALGFPIYELPYTPDVMWKYIRRYFNKEG